MLDYNTLYEIEDNYQPVASIKVRKFRDHSKPKQTQTTHNNYRIITNDLLD
jgi:hypothetical protein